MQKTCFHIWRLTMRLSSSALSLHWDNYHQYSIWTQTVQQTTNGDTFVELLRAFHDRLYSECWATLSVGRTPIKKRCLPYPPVSSQKTSNFYAFPISFGLPYMFKPTVILLYRLLLAKKSISNCGTIQVSEVLFFFFSLLSDSKKQINLFLQQLLPSSLFTTVTSFLSSIELCQPFQIQGVSKR